MDLLVYIVLVACVLRSVFAGGPAALYAAALLMPLTQAMPTPIPVVSAPTNLMLIGMFSAKLRAPAEAEHGRSPLPLKVPIILMVVTLLGGLAIRGGKELGGEFFLMPFSETAKSVWYWLTPFTLFWLAYRIGTTDEIARKAFLFCELSMAGECLVTVPEQVMYGRASAHFGEPNQAGTYFAAACAFFLARFLCEDGRKRWLYFAASGIAASAVFNTLSRGGLGAAAIACTLVSGVFFLSPRRPARIKILFAAIVVIAIANFTLIVPKKVIDRVLFTFGGDAPEQVHTDELDESSEERLTYWQIAFDLYKANPWGYGSFTFPQYMIEKNPKDVHKQAHNAYLQVLVEDGTQGFVAMLLLVFSVAGVLLRTYGRDGPVLQQNLALSLFGWWIAHSVAHIVVNSFFLAIVAGQFWIMLACLFRLGKDRGTHEVAAGVAAQAGPRRRITRRRPARVGRTGPQPAGEAGASRFGAKRPGETDDRSDAVGKVRGREHREER